MYIYISILHFDKHTEELFFINITFCILHKSFQYSSTRLNLTCNHLKFPPDYIDFLSSRLQEMAWSQIGVKRFLESMLIINVFCLIAPINGLGADWRQAIFFNQCWLIMDWSTSNNIPELYMLDILWRAGGPNTTALLVTKCQACSWNIAGFKAI